MCQAADAARVKTTRRYFPPAADGRPHTVTGAIVFSSEHKSNVRIGANAEVAQLVEQPIRNRQVIGSSPIVGSSFSSTCGSVHRDLLHICCTSNFCFQPLHRLGHHARHRLDVASLRRLNVFVAQDRLDHLVRDSEFVQVRG